ncbi:MAG: hypothetical protein ACJ74Z_01910 [Bryobacteraceae bacterium]
MPCICHENRVEAVVQSAWRRCFLLLALEQLAFALAVFFAGGILMLLLGTQILDWHWLMLLSVTAVAVSVVRTRFRILTRYRVAQLVDRRVGLNDSLSTAWFLLSQSTEADNSVSRFQIEQAERSASSVDLTSAFPFGTQFRKQRVWALAGVLGVAMFVLFVARYFAHTNLSFKESLIPIRFPSVWERVEHSFSTPNQLAEDPGAADEEAQTAKPAPQGRGDKRSEAPRLRDAGAERQPIVPNGQQSTTPDPASQEDPKVANGDPETAVGVSQRRNPRDRETREMQAHPSTPDSNGNTDIAGNQSSSSGLLEKMKDAISSALAKMKTAQNSDKAAQNNERSAEASKTEQQSSAKNKQQGENPNGGTERARNDASSAGGEQGQTKEKTEASQGRNSDQSPDKNGSDAHSGIGSQDGEKQLKEAEQLQAMGKLAEIIGKRSANLTGEVTVETSSGKQRLKTEDSQRIGQHSDLGGEINRDEIPLMYQQYVREYMERVHKQAKNSR